MRMLQNFSKTSARLLVSESDSKAHLKIHQARAFSSGSAKDKIGVPRVKFILAPVIGLRTALSRSLPKNPLLKESRCSGRAESAFKSLFLPTQKRSKSAAMKQLPRF